jgi:hypothetical protein
MKVVAALVSVPVLALASAAHAATITVTTTADSMAIDGKISIREAVGSINSGVDLNSDVTHTGTYGANDTIVIPASSAHYMVTAGEIDPNTPLTITGAGPSSTVIDAGGANRTFHFPSTGGSATISGVEFTGGHSTTGHGGGAIMSDLPQVDITGSAFVGNSATASGGQVNGGGALWLASGGTIDSTTFTGNSFTGTGGIGNNGGGAIFNSNLALTVTNSTFSGNSASIESTSNNGGGAIYQDGSDETFTHDTFTNNSVQMTATGGSAQSNGGGANYQDGRALTVEGTTFGGNALSITGVSANSGGGAIFHDGTGELSLTNSTFDGNSASPLGSGPVTGGGGLISNSSSQTTITNSTFFANNTSGTGGNLLGSNGASTIVPKNAIFAGGVGLSASNCAGPAIFSSVGHNLEDTTPSQCGLTASSDKVGLNPLLGPLVNNGGGALTLELLPGSPAVDAGDDSGCPTTDERGLTRPQGAACDIGALEVLPPSATTGGASGVGATSATLNGSVANPNGLVGGIVYFQFGETTTYDRQSQSEVLAAGAPAVPLAANVSALPPGKLIHFRAVAVTPDGTSFGADSTFTTTPRPSLTALRMSPASFRPERGRGASIARRKGGAFVSYTDSQAATTTFTVQRRVRGFRSGRRCVARRPRRGRARRCTIFHRVGSFKHKDSAGRNRFHFSGRVRRRGLKPGRYRLHALALGAGSQKSAARNTSFRIIR